MYHIDVRRNSQDFSDSFPQLYSTRYVYCKLTMKLTL